MKRQALKAIALLLATSIAAYGSSLSEEKRRNRLQMLRTEGARQIHLSRLDQAYVDAVSLLEHGHTCGEFFGEAASAQVLENLAVTLQNGLIRDPSIGLMMFGQSTNFFNSQTGISYRLFAKAEINTSGPFYKSKVWPEDPFIPNVGSFPPNTREARVLILLHELAHLIKGPDETWLIPDDGGNTELSKKNTLTVEAKCGEQIRSL
jgi:hypothetical protein